MLLMLTVLLLMLVVAASPCVVYESDMSLVNGTYVLHIRDSHVTLRVVNMISDIAVYRMTDAQYEILELTDMLVDVITEPSTFKTVSETHQNLMLISEHAARVKWIDSMYISCRDREGMRVLTILLSTLGTLSIICGVLILRTYVKYVVRMKRLMTPQYSLNMTIN